MEINHLIEKLIHKLYFVFCEAILCFVEGAFLVGENAWYPNIRALMKWCDAKKVSYVIGPVSDSAVTASETLSDIICWLSDRGKRVRLSALVTPQPTNGKTGKG